MHLPNHCIPLLLTLALYPLSSRSDLPCRDQCGTIQIHYPFGIEDGCGAPQFRHMFTCNTTSLSLFFITPNGNYKVQSIDYKSQTLTVYDPDMSTCTILQPHHDLVLSDLQYAIIPPSPDTIFALLNCSIDTPILHRYRSLCFDFSGHKCEELYSACNSFRIFTSSNLLTPGINNNTSGPAGYFYAGGYNNNINNDSSNNNNNVGSGVGPLPPPPCCFTGYSTVKVMSMDILDCTHFTSFYDVDKLRGVGPMDWSYGLKFSYSVPDMGCERCRKSGGSCGFDSETEALLCLCSSSSNSTRDCDAGNDVDAGDWRRPSSILEALITRLGILFLFGMWVEW